MPIYAQFGFDYDEHIFLYSRNQTHGAKTVFFTTLSRPFINVELEFLSIYYPNPDEIDDAKLYANNLRQHMANALKVPTSDLTFAEAKEKYKNVKKNRKLKDVLKMVAKSKDD